MKREKVKTFNQYDFNGNIESVIAILQELRNKYSNDNLTLDGDTYCEPYSDDEKFVINVYKENFESIMDADKNYIKIKCFNCKKTHYAPTKKSLWMRDSHECPYCEERLGKTIAAIKKLKVKK